MIRCRSVAVVALIAFAGCKGDRTPTTVPVVAPTPRHVEPSPASNLDPCALRLHDLCGSILLYYFTYQRLPAQLDEVNTFPDHEDVIPLACPTSGLPYVYNRDGIQLPERHARVIVYDATPAHAGGRRWAIRFSEPGDEKAIVAEVVALPESFFFLRPPTATTMP